MGSRRRVSRRLPEDQGARCGAAAASGGPLEGRQVRGGHRAGAADAQVHGAQHHRQVPAQQHSREPAAQRTTKETLRGWGGGGSQRGKKRGHLDRKSWNVTKEETEKEKVGMERQKEGTTDGAL